MVRPRSLIPLLVLGSSLFGAAVPARAAAAVAPACAPAATQVARSASAGIELRCTDPLTGAAATLVEVDAPPVSGTATAGSGQVTYVNDGTGSLDRFTVLVRGAADAPAARLTVEVGIGTVSRPSCGVPGLLRVRPGRRVSGRVTCADSSGAAGTYARTDDPALGTLVATSFATTGAFRFDAAGAEGDTSFGVGATTAAGSAVTVRQPLAVTQAANAVPVCQDRAVTVRPGSTRTLSLPCADADGDRLTVATGTVATGQLGTVRQSAGATDATVTYAAPDGTSADEAIFTFTAEDGRETSAAARVVVTIDPSFTNTTPTCSFTSLTLERGAQVDVGTDCTDVDADPIAYALVPGSARHLTVGAPVTSASGATTFPVTVADDYTGEDAGFRYTADDGQGGSGSGEVQVTVGARPVPSCRTPARDVLRSGRFVGVDLSRLCSGATRYDVVDGSAVNGRVVTAGTSGAVEFQAAAAAADGQVASFAFVASNGAGSEQPVTVAYDTGPSANHAPTCVAPELTHVRLGATREVAFTCTDADGDALTATIAGADGPGRGVASVLGTGRVRYTAPTDVTATPAADPFTVTVADGFSGGSARVTVAIAVEDLAFNTLPSCTGSVPVAPRVDEARPVILSCSDADGDRITAIRVSGATGGTVEPFTRAADDGTRWTGRFRAGTTPGAAGFDVAVADERAFAPATHIDLEVREAAVNAAPTCPPLRVSTTAGEPLVVDPAGACADPDGDPLTTAVALAPRHGTLTADGGTLRYVAEPAYEGVDAFEVTVDDGHGATATARVTIDVERPADAPAGAQPLPPAAPPATPTGPATGGAAAGGGAVPAAPGPGAADTTAPRLRLHVGKGRLKRIVRKGLAVTLTCDEACTGGIVATVPGKVAKRLGLVRRAKKPIVIVRTGGTGRLMLRFTGRLAKLKRVHLTVTATGTDAAGNAARQTVAVTLRR